MASQDGETEALATVELDLRLRFRLAKSYFALIASTSFSTSSWVKVPVI
jgi:hypothetical protein